jgi:hypothetical protein
MVAINLGIARCREGWIMSLALMQSLGDWHVLDAARKAFEKAGLFALTNRINRLRKLRDGCPRRTCCSC